MRSSVWALNWGPGAPLVKYKVTYVPVEPFTAKNQLFKTPITCTRVILELLPKRQLDQ